MSRTCYVSAQLSVQVDSSSSTYYHLLPIVPLHTPLTYNLFQDHTHSTYRLLATPMAISSESNR